MNKEILNVLHTSAYISKKGYGLGQVCVSLAQAQLNLGISSNIWCFDEEDEVQWTSKNHGYPKNRITRFNLKGPSKLYFSPELIKRSNMSIDNPSIIHQHGLWTGMSIASLVLRKKFGIPTVIAPHGSLTKVALKGSFFKKKIALTVYERKNLN